MKGFGRTVSIRRGDEGPHYDPYSFTELTVTKPNGSSIMLHTGLAVRLEINGKPVEDINPAKDDEAEKLRLFEVLTGASPDDWERWYHRYKSTCTCGCRRTMCSPGFPGETLNICIRCGEIVSSDVNLRSIE